IDIVLENDLGGFLVPLPGARPERPQDEREEHEHHGQEAPAVRQVTQELVGRMAGHRPFSRASSCCAAAEFTSTSVPSICRCATSASISVRRLGSPSKSRICTLG